MLGQKKHLNIYLEDLARRPNPLSPKPPRGKLNYLFEPIYCADSGKGTVGQMAKAFGAFYVRAWEDPVQNHVKISGGRKVCRLPFFLSRCDINQDKIVQRRKKVVGYGFQRQKCENLYCSNICSMQLTHFICLQVVLLGL